MRDFTPCRGKQACVEKDDQCLTCGRSLDEIAHTRQLIDALSELVLTVNYGNVDAFATYVATKICKKVQYRRDNPQ